MTILSTLEKQDRDGGYYAIKGFLYQFDRTLIEIFSNPNTKIKFECQQDINYEDFIIQVKHKEASDYTLSSIRPAVKQLFDLFKNNKEKRYRLYCHFKNKIPGANEELIEQQLSLENLNQILTTDQHKYDQDLKVEFIKNFKICFLHDFNESFNQLVEMIKTHFDIMNNDIAIYYHAIFQTELSRLSIQPRPQRFLSTKDLEELILNHNEIIFFEGYQNHLSQEKYFKLIKNKYFTHNKAHITPHERVFIIDFTQNCTNETLIDVIYKISYKFFRPNVSPAPFICIRNFPKDSLNKIKQSLIDLQFYFNDGTFFDGDRIRIEELYKKQDSKIMIRFIDEHNLFHLNAKLNHVETYQFYTNKPINLSYNSKNVSISIKDTADILNMIS